MGRKAVHVPDEVNQSEAWRCLRLMRLEEKEQNGEREVKSDAGRVGGGQATPNAGLAYDHYLAINRGLSFQRYWR